jgi:Cu/Ag efflux protein CusF
MMYITKCLTVALSFALLTGTAGAAESVATGKVKSINSDNKSFVITDSAAKDHTFKFADNLVINRGGKESKSDLKVGDPVNICFDKGTLSWTAHYILVREGATKDSELFIGTVKGYDAAKKQITITDESKKDWFYSADKVRVRLNMEDTKIDDVKIGDRALFVTETLDGKSALKCIMVHRDK